MFGNRVGVAGGGWQASLCLGAGRPGSHSSRPCSHRACPPSARRASEADLGPPVRKSQLSSGTAPWAAWSLPPPLGSRFRGPLSRALQICTERSSGRCSPATRLLIVILFALRLLLRIPLSVDRSVSLGRSHVDCFLSSSYSRARPLAPTGHVAEGAGADTAMHVPTRDSHRPLPSVLHTHTHTREFANHSCTTKPNF